MRRLQRVFLKMKDFMKKNPTENRRILIFIKQILLCGYSPKEPQRNT